MSIPYISLWGPSLPLLIWTSVSAVCGLILVGQAIILALRARGSIRWLAIVLVAVSGVIFLLAMQMWTAYLGVACPYAGELSYPLPCFNPKLAAQAVAQFQPLGWAALAGTIVLLVVSIMWRRQSRHSAS